MSSGRFPSVDVRGDPQPRDVPFRLVVEKRRDFSPDDPARIRVSFENRSSTEQPVGFGAIQPFSGIWSEGDSLLVLVPSDRAFQKHVFGTDERIVPDRPVDGCWRTNLVRLIVPDVLRRRTLDAGERIRTDYVILHYPEREILAATDVERFAEDIETADCLPAGDYRFEDSFHNPSLRLAKHGKRGANSEFDAQDTWSGFGWGFTITIGE